MKYLLMIFLFFAFSSSINAPQEVMTPVMLVEVGVGTDEELEVDGYNLIESNVLWDIPGEYEATYYYLNQPSYFYRTIIIATEAEFEEGIAHYQEQRLSQASAVYHVRNAIFENEDCYYVIGTVESEDPFQQSILLQEYAFIAYYEHYVQVFCHFFNESYSYLSGAELSDAGLVYFLTFTNGDDTDVQVGEITQTGTIIRSQDFGGSGDEKGFKCFAYQGQLTLFFTSTSQDGLWGNRFGSNSGLIALQINQINWSITRLRQFGNDQSNRFIDGGIVNDHFYLYIDVKGEGDFFNPNPNHHQTVALVMNPDLSIELSQLINVIAGTMRMMCGAQELYFWKMDMSGDTSKLIVKTYDLGIRLERSLEYQLPSSTTRITSITASTNEEGTTLFFFNQNDATKDSFGGAFEIQGNQLKKWRYNQTLEQGIGVYAHQQWHIMGSSEDALVYATLTCCETPIYQTHNYLYYVLPEKHVIINGIILGRVGLPSLETIDYGYYEEKSNFSSSSTVIILKNTFYIPLITNIRDQELYDCGMRITFNGEGYLNDEAISSGTEVLHKGTYQLIIIGQGNVRKVINFQIQDLTPLYPSTPPIQNPLIQNQVESIPSLTPLYAMMEGEMEHLETIEWGWMIIIMLTLTGAMLGLWLHCPKRFHR